MFYHHDAYVNNQKCVAYVYKDGQFRRTKSYVWVDPVPFMVADENGEYHLYTINNEPVYVHAYKLPDTSTLALLTDNQGNYLTDDNGKQLVGYIRGGQAT